MSDSPGVNFLLHDSSSSISEDWSTTEENEDLYSLDDEEEKQDILFTGSSNNNLIKSEDSFMSQKEPYDKIIEFADEIDQIAATDDGDDEFSYENDNEENIVDDIYDSLNIFEEDIVENQVETNINNINTPMLTTIPVKEENGDKMEVENTFEQLKENEYPVIDWKSIQLNILDINENNKKGLQHGDSNGDIINELTNDNKKQADNLNSKVKAKADDEKVDKEVMEIQEISNKQLHKDIPTQSIQELAEEKKEIKQVFEVNNLKIAETIEENLLTEEKTKIQPAEIKPENEQREAEIVTENLCRDMDAEIELDSEPDSEVSSDNMARESEIESVIMKHKSEPIENMVQNEVEDEEEEIVSAVFDTEPLHPVETPADEFLKSDTVSGQPENVVDNLDASGEKENKAAELKESANKTSIKGFDAVSIDKNVIPIEAPSVKPKEVKQKSVPIGKAKKEYGNYIYESNEPLISEEALTIASASDTLKLLKAMSSEHKSEDIQQKLSTSSDIPNLRFKQYQEKVRDQKISRRQATLQEEKSKLESLVKSLNECHIFQIKTNEKRDKNVSHPPQRIKSAPPSKCHAKPKPSDVYSRFLASCIYKKVYYLEPCHPIIVSHNNKGDRRLKSVCAKNGCIIEIEGPLFNSSGISDVIRIIKRHDKYYTCTVSCPSQVSLDKCINYIKATFNASLQFI